MRGRVYRFQKNEICRRDPKYFLFAGEGGHEVAETLVKGLFEPSEGPPDKALAVQPDYCPDTRQYPEPPEPFQGAHSAVQISVRLFRASDFIRPRYHFHYL